MSRASELSNKIKSLQEAYNRKDVEIISKYWNEFNDKFFNGRLTKPRLAWLPKQPVSSIRKYGHWDKINKEICLSPILLNKIDALKNVLIHEMCHQAVTEINNAPIYVRKYDRSYQGGHGEQWKQWMEACGRNPNRFVQIDELPFP